MKQSIFFVLISILLFSACDKLPKNGDLDGMWQLMTVEKTGEPAENVKAKKLFYSFQLDLVQFSDANWTTDRSSYYAYFKRKGESMWFHTICKPSKNESEEDDNVPFTQEEIEVQQVMAPWGIYTLNPRFKVLQLDSDAMILQSEQAKLTFRKF